MRWLCAFAFAAVPALAQIAGRSAPAPVVPRSVSVRVGESVVIPLETYGSSGRQLEYLIRSNPRFGLLGKVQSTALDTAIVTYTAGGKPGTDQFTYAVRDTKGVSAPGLVSITISERVMIPARLAVPDELDFPTVILGQRSTALLELKNVGGSPAKGTVELAPPWTLEGSANYQIAAGETARMTLVFDPKASGPAEGKAIVSRLPLRVVALTGKAERALSFSPAKLKLFAPPGSQTRTATLTIANQSSEDRVVTLTAGPRLLTGKTASVRAMGSVEIPVFAEAGEPTAFDEKIHIESGGWSADVPVHAAAMGALIRVASLEVPANAVAEKPAQIVLLIANSGATNASILVAPEPPLAITNGAALVPPSESARVIVTHPGPAVGDFAGTIAIKSSGQTLSQPVKFTAVAATASSPAPAPDPAPDPRKPAPAKESQPSLPAKAAPPSSPSLTEHPNGRGRLGSATSPTTALIEWPADFGTTTGLTLQRRTIAADSNSGILESWVPGPPCAITQTAGKMRAEITDLNPSQLHTLRIVEADGEPLLTVSFATPTKPPFFHIGWQSVTLTILFATLAGIAWWKWKNRSRSGW